MNTAIAQLKGIGPALEQRFHVLGIHTIEDLVYHLPIRHEDLSELTQIAHAHPGEKITVRGTIARLNGRRGRRARMYITQARIDDESGSIQAIWFNQPYIQENLKVGDQVLLSGSVKKSAYGMTLNSPTYEKVHDHAEQLHVGRIVAQYPLTAGITQKQMRFFIKQALDRYLPTVDYLPQEIVLQHDLMDLNEALKQIHLPESEDSSANARRRLEFDELYLLQLMAQQTRAQLRTQPAPRLQFFEAEIRECVQSLPFQLTQAQRKAAWEILKDMQQAHPMNRLLVGDVGSGKTIVAALALYNCVLNGYQGAFMAPTEILAQQHARYLQELFTNVSLPDDEAVRIELCTSSTRTGRRNDKQQSVLPSLQPHILVGTHALIQDHTNIERLGLAVVDEQHRFGVEQRKKLKEQNASHVMPHLLSMTATPIPRTLALALYGDLDLSVLNERPVGRKPIITKLVPSNKRSAAYAFIDKHITTGEQIFVLCPRIDIDDVTGMKSVTQEYERLQREVFPGRRIGMLHGKMKSAEKDNVMKQMRDGELDILVATSVIEVGVHIPNATIMFIEGADRFGLAQLHQFRGRVGRSDKQSYCFLSTDSRSPQTLDRLQALISTNDGFALAEYDLEHRGAGEMFGSEQSGFSHLSSLNLTNLPFIQSAQTAAEETLQHNWINTHEPLQKKFEHYRSNVHLE